MIVDGHYRCAHPRRTIAARILRTGGRYRRVTMLHDGATEVDHEARRLAGLILVGEWRRIVAHRKADRLPLFDTVERSSGGRTERQRCGGQGDPNESRNQRAFAIAANVRRSPPGGGGARLVFVPRYSLDLNPKEHLFAKLKSFVRKAAPRLSTPFPMRSLTISKPSHPPHAQTISQTRDTRQTTHKALGSRLIRSTR